MTHVLLLKTCAIALTKYIPVINAVNSITATGTAIINKGGNVDTPRAAPKPTNAIGIINAHDATETSPPIKQFTQLSRITSIKYFVIIR